MYVRTPCPNCGKKLRISENSIDHRIKCPHCRTGFEVTEAKIERAHGFPGGLQRSHHAAGGIKSIYRDLEGASQHRGTNANLLLTGLCSVGITAFFYGVIVFPLHQVGFGKLFVENGWVPYVIILLAAWCACILAVKIHKLTRQRESLLFDVLPMELSPRIRPEYAERFMRHIQELPCDYKQNFMLNRVYRALNNYRVRGNVQEVATLLEAQGEIDNNTVQSSYTILKVCIWAIPILGFIGTVVGISGAVGDFSSSLQGLQEMDQIRGALGNVTKNLGTAFDTTFLALVVSLLVMFPTSSVQKSEEDFLTSVDEYCNESLLGRLRESKKANGKHSDDLKEAVTEALREQQRRMQGWVTQLESLGQTVTSQVSEGWQDVHQQLHQDQEENLRQLNVILESLAQERVAFVDQVKAVQDDQVGKVGKMLAAAGDTGRQIQEQLNALQAGQLQNFQDVVASLSNDLKALQTECSSHYRQEANTLQSLAEQFVKRLTQMQEQVDALHTQTAANLQNATSEQQQTVSHLDRIARTLADEAQSLQSLVEQTEATRQAQTKDMLAGLEQQHEAVTSTAGKQLAQTMEGLNQLVETMIATQKQYSQDMLTSAKVQQKLAAHLEALAKSNTLGKRLTDIEQGLDRLSSEVARATETADPSNDNRVRGGLLSLFKRGERHG